MVCALAVGMATSAFAADGMLKAPSIGVGSRNRFCNRANTSLYMNVAGNEARNPHQNVMAYTMVPYSNDQLWTIRVAGNGGYYIVPGADRGYALNVYRKGSEWNADLYLLNKNETDATMSLVSTGGYYRVCATNYNTYYLTAKGISPSSNIVFSPHNNLGNVQVWNIYGASM